MNLFNDLNCDKAFVSVDNVDNDEDDDKDRFNTYVNSFDKQTFT